MTLSSKEIWPFYKGCGDIIKIFKNCNFIKKYCSCKHTWSRV